MANDSQARPGALIVAALRVLLLVICILAIPGAMICLWPLAVASKYMDDYMSSPIYIGIKHFYYWYYFCIFIFSSVGAHAAYTSKPKYLRVFALLLLFRAVLTNSLQIWFYTTTDWNQEKSQLSERLQDWARDYQMRPKFFEEPNRASKAWDRLQSGLGCCGFDSRFDWLNTTSDEFTLNIRVPASCCSDTTSRFDDTCRLLNSNTIYDTGCWERIQSLLPTSIGLICLDFICSFILAAIALFLAHKNNPANVVKAYSKSQTFIALV